MRATINRVLDLLLYFEFCALTGIGLMLAWRLPPGSQGGRGLTVLDMCRHEWGDIHLWVGIAFIATVVAHLLMHWKWLKTVASRMRSWPLWGGLLAGVAVVLVFVLWPVDSPRGSEIRTDVSHLEVR
jgi:hypothetical protein